MSKDKKEEGAEAKPKDAKDKKDSKETKDTEKKESKGEEKKGKEKKESKDAKEAREKKDIKKDEALPDDFKYMVRIANTDINGTKPFFIALASIRGVGLRTAIALADKVGFDRHKKIGYMTDEQIQKVAVQLEDMIDLVPHWMLNRQNDIETGEDMFVFGPDLKIKVQDDINLMKKIRCYRGVRHEEGKKVRGQRTSSNGRKGLTLGVVKKKEGAPAAAPAADKK